MMISPADLKYFSEIAQTLNVSRAAERLGISQPSLSLALQRIEASLGTAVMIRSKRGVSLTPAGKQLLAQSRHLMQMWENVRSQALASVNEVQGAYTIGCHPSVGLYGLSHVLPRLMAEHSKLEIKLMHDISRKIAEDVISLKVDIGIVVNPVQHPDLIIQPLCKDEFTLWTNGAAVADVLICDAELGQSQALIRKFAKIGLKFTRTITSGNLEMIADLTARGCGYGLLPAQVADRACNKLKRVPKAPVFYDEHALVFRVENKGIKSIQAINKAIKSFYAAG